MDKLLESLADEDRRRIVRVLVENPRVRHKELLELLKMSRGQASRLTKCLKPLEATGLVERVESGGQILYEVVDGAAAEDVLRSASQLWAAASAALVRRAKREADQARHDAEHFDDGLT
jgi:DNA-binding transcriptional ArsR family regulator